MKGESEKMAGWVDWEDDVGVWHRSWGLAQELGFGAGAGV